jgi:predicted TIM-barrel fold metal-dependent hydrolase
MLERQLRAFAPILAIFLFTAAPGAHSHGIQAPGNQYEFNDSHFHLTNYIQEGTPIREFLKIMGSTTGRSVLFGIPLQQQWSHGIDGDFAPTYYLDSDAPLYYYSFTDAHIAMAYLSLSPEERRRFDPMITGFNPADMYATDHIRRVLQTFPGVFCGIGEFSIHKEFVSGKIAGGAAGLLNPALDRLLDFAEETGLVVLIHNDVDRPFANPDLTPAYLEPMKALLRRHSGTTIIWAHTGVGRVVRPIKGHAKMLEDIITDSGMRHVMFDISWDEMAKYVVASPASMKVMSDLINRYPDRFLFGTDSVAPKTQQEYLKAYRIYDPLWPLLTKEASDKLRKDNYTRTFDAAAARVRAWEASQGSTRVSIVR